MHILWLRLVWKLHMEPLVIGTLTNLVLESMWCVRQAGPLRAAATTAALNNLLEAARTKRVIRQERPTGAALHNLLEAASHLESL